MCRFFRHPKFMGGFPWPLLVFGAIFVFIKLGIPWWFIFFLPMLFGMFKSAGQQAERAPRRRPYGHDGYPYGGENEKPKRKLKNEERHPTGYKLGPDGEIVEVYEEPASRAS
jgi:hypothetical protein